MKNTTYALNESIIAREEQDGILLYDKKTEGIKILNKTGVSILQLCDRSHTIDDIAAKLYEEYPMVPKDTLKGDVERILSLLEACNIVDGGEKCAV